MVQIPITDFFVPTGDAQIHPEAAIDDFFEIGALSITMKIYLYSCATTGVAIYVGQTIQRLDQRDRQHLGNVSGAPGSFDRVYTDRNMFRLEIIDQQTFDAEIHTREEYRALLHRTSQWGDGRETHFIDRNGTYNPLGPGLNRTRGGQGNALQASLEFMFLRSCERMANVYRPAFETHLAEHGTLRHIPQNHPTLGRLVGSIRTGHTSVPTEHMEWLLANGFVMNHQQAVWDQDYRPAFEAHLAEHGTLRHIPKTHPTLGSLVGSIRTGDTSVPTEHMEWLRENGLRWSTRNVAAHVAGYLDMARTDLPADAVLNEAVLHCLREAARLELFGQVTVPELVVRYNENRARL